MVTSYGMTAFHADVLEPGQREVLAILGPHLSHLGFYLGGGTGVALHLGHRRSGDFDWFANADIGDPMALAASLRTDGIPLQVVSAERGTLHANLSGVRVTFLEYRYGLLDSPVEWEEYRCRVAALDDLACMKLAAVAQRGTRKDFVDIYALVREHRPLATLLELYRRKYGVEDVGHVVFGLGYFDDADDDVMPVMQWDVAWDEVRSFMARSVRELSRNSDPTWSGG